MRLAISMSLLVKVSTWLFDWSMMSVIWVEHKLEKKDQSARLKFQFWAKSRVEGVGEVMRMGKWSLPHCEGKTFQLEKSM